MESAPQTLRPCADVVYERMGEEVVLLHMATDRIYALNPTAACAWELLTAGQNRAQIELQLSREYAVESHQVARELDDFFALLLAENLAA